MKLTIAVRPVAKGALSLQTRHKVGIPSLLASLKLLSSKNLYFAVQCVGSDFSKNLLPSYKG